MLRERLVHRHSFLRHVLPRGHRPYLGAAGRIYLDLRESPMMFARALRIYEPEKHALLRSLLRSGMVFVDVGANKGDFTLLGAHAVGASGAVHAVEPEPENAMWLRRSVEINHLTNVNIHEVALGDADGEATLYLGPMSGLHSLVARGHAGKLRVPLRRFDSLFLSLPSPPDVVKIDVEGAERQVIAGFGSMRPRFLAIDVHPSQYDLADLRSVLSELGYSISVKGDGWFAERR